MLYAWPAQIIHPPGQVFSPKGRLSVTLGTGRDTRLVRYKTVDFEVLGVVARQERSKTLPVFSTTADSSVVTSHSNSHGEIQPKPEDRYRVPVLGPTRQQTELYLKKKKTKKR
ncbi:hypothetical protein ACJMK2_028029 [Sinanodonta woodiana]|uniref:Uncharacterized protein n=1 Tax=Sinanodonta woodiana TaxID=1069815 RepID=A0ABD3X800_SINWO